MPVAHHREREVTYDVDAEWEMPDLAPAAQDGRRVVRTTHSLAAVYHDTERSTLRLLGFTLRRREGGADAGWHLKIPAGDARTEVHSQAAGSAVPGALARRLDGVIGAERLRPVATVETTRHTVQIFDADGELVLEVADDRVRGTRAGTAAPPTAWREVEIELGPAGSEADLEAVAALFEAAGATSATVQRKINHVLVDPPRAEVEGVPGLVADYLRDQCRAVLVGDVRLRDDPTSAAVHRTRVAIRRLRSAIRMFPAALSVEEAELGRIDADLRRLGALLSPIRDGDILERRLLGELDALSKADVLGPVREEVRRALRRQRADGFDDWLGARDGEWYRRLLTTLGDWYAAPPVREDAAAHPGKTLAAARRKLRRRRSAAVDAHGLHQARKAAKRLRYAADLLTPAVSGAKKTAKRAKRLQTRWGEHQDLVVAVEFLRRRAALAGTSEVRNGFTYGVLVARLDDRSRAIREAEGASR